jgi:crotonobetaine/carnitine-CoA ligase
VLPLDVGRADDDPGGVGTDPALVAPRLLASRARESPDHPFLTDVGGVRVTYREALDRVLRWCHLLRDVGVRDADRLASLLPASVDATCAWFACGLSRIVEVPVNPELRGESLRHVLTDAGVRTCLIRPEQREVLAECQGLGLNVVVVDREGTLIAHRPVQAVDDFPTPKDVACVIYTSGTTGPSKGVVVTWAQLSGIIGRLPRSWFGPSDVAYAPWPMFHVTGRSPVIVMLDAGGQVVLRERFSLTDFWDDVCAHGVTYTTVAPVVRLLLDAPGPRPGEHSLRVVFGGSDARASVEFKDRFGVRVCTSYGSTEIGFPIVNRDCTAATAHVAGWPRRGYLVRAVDAGGNDVDHGEIGELLVRPPVRELMLREYLGQSELTARALAGGWYHTGDAVRLFDDGSVQFVDRMRDTIRRFGENISSVAVESVVAAREEILECAVVGVPSRAAGQDVFLVVVPAPAGLDLAALFDALRDELPRHALPAYIAITDELPKTPNGKARKADLGALLADAWHSPAARD